MDILRAFVILICIFFKNQINLVCAYNLDDFDEALLEQYINDNTNDKLQFETTYETSFLHPGTEINCTNAENVKIIQSNSNELYVLSKTELFHIRFNSEFDVGSDEFYRLEFIGKLDGIEEFQQIHGFRTIKWNGILIIVIALADYYVIYMRPFSDDGGQIEPLNLVPIQRIGPLDGSSRRIVLVAGEDNQLYCLLGIAHTELLGKIVLYKWRNSHFSIVDERNLFAMDDVLLFKNHHEILFLIVQNGNSVRKTTIEAFNLGTNHQLVRLQLLYFVSSHIKPYIFDGRFYFISCFQTQKCFIYQWDSLNKVFKRYQKLDESIQIDEIDQFAFRDNYIALQQESVQLYTDPRLTKMSAVLDQVPFELTHMYLMQDKKQKQEFLVLMHLKEPILRILFLGISKKETMVTALPSDNSTKTPEEVIEQRLEKLKNLLIERIDGVVNLKTQLNGTINLKKNLNITNRIQLKPSSILYLDKVQLEEASILHRLDTSADNLMRDVVALNIRRAELNNQLENLLYTNEANVIQGDLLVHGNLTTATANIRAIHTENRPDEVLLNKAKNNDSSEFPENLTAHTVIVKRLLVPPTSGHYQHLLQKSLVNHLNGPPVKIGKLITNSLQIKNSMINNVNLSSVVRRQDTGSEFTLIRGTKHIQKIHTTNLTVASINDFDFLTILVDVVNNLKQVEGGWENVHLPNGSVTSSKLKAKLINGLNWEEFYKSLFLKGRDRKIDGNLTFSHHSTVHKLETPKINNIATQNLMTLTSNQTINSDIFIQKFLTSDLTTHGLLNGAINFKEDVVQIGKQNFIETPVQFQHIEVQKSLEIEEEEHSELLARHIIGTRIDDLSQLYTGKVIINGSLTLKNLQIAENKSRILVDNRDFDMDIADKYWMKSINQNLYNVRFSSPVKVVHLLAEKLNNHPTEQHIFITPSRNDEKYDTNFVSLIIENAQINGSVNVHSNTKSYIAQINATAVRRNQTTSIVGKLSFIDELIIDHLQTEDLDQQSTIDLVRHNQSYIYFTGNKGFTQMHVNGAIELDSGNNQNHPKLLIHSLNGHNMLTFFRDAVLTDDENLTIKLDNVSFKSLNCETVDLGSINGMQFHELTEQMQEISNGKHSVQNLNVTAGDVIFSGKLFVDAINGLNIQDYLELVVVPTVNNGQIGGSKRFAEGLTITETAQMDKAMSTVSVDDWLENSLVKTAPQTISGEWKFNNVISKHVAGPEIDGVLVKNLIDSQSSDNIDVYSNLYIHQLNVARDLLGPAKIDFKELANRLKFPACVNWQTLEIVGDVKLPVTEKTKLDDLLTKPVTKHGPPQSITGEVTFKSVPKLQHVLTKIPNAFQGVDLLGIYLDGLKRHANYPQIVLSAKNFVNDLVINASMQAMEYVRVPVVNGVDVQKLNASIVRVGHDQVIVGEKTFAEPLKVDYLYVASENRMNNVSVDNLVFLRNNRPIPGIIFHNLSVSNNFMTLSVNNFSLEHLLLNRVRKYSSMLLPTDALLPSYLQQQHQQDIGGYLTFENLIIQGDDTHISSINDVRLDDVVFENAEYLQDVAGVKVIEGQLTLIGPSVIEMLNDFDLSELYQQSVSTISSKVYVNSLELNDKVILEKGLVVNQQINDKSIEKVLHYSPPDDLTAVVPMVPVLNQLINRCEDLSARPHSKHLLYLDYDADLEIVHQKPTPESLEEGPSLSLQRYVKQDENHSDGSYLKCQNPPKLEPHFDPIRITPDKRIYVKRHQTDVHKSNTTVEQNRRVKKQYGSTLNLTIENNCNEIDSYLSLTEKEDLKFGSTVSPMQESPKSSIQLQWRPRHATSIDYNFQNFTFVQRIKDLRMIEPNDLQQQLLVVLFHRTKRSNASIDVLGLDNSEPKSEWRLLQQILIVGDAMIETAATNNYELLLVSVLDDRKDNTEEFGSVEGNGAIYIYCFDPYTELFIDIQRIPGRFDLLTFAYIQSPNYDEYMLLLGQKRNRFLQIYKIDETNALSTIPQYIMFQKINFDATITKISTFQIEDTHLLAVLLDTGDFYLYKYNFVEGWIRIATGHFPGIKTLVPFNNLDQNYLFISSAKSATAISIYLQ